VHEELFTGKGGGGQGGRQNPKSEIRNPKEIRSPNALNHGRIRINTDFFTETKETKRGIGIAIKVTIKSGTGMED
jgi:hypothetical protein